MKKFKHWGPFSYYKLKKDGGHISAWPTGCENSSFGWEWGYRDAFRGTDAPMIDIRIGKLRVLYVEFWPKGFELAFLGLWWIR